MKYLKTYEKNIDNPQVGDYVIVHVDLKIYEFKDIVNNFINNNVGKIVHENEFEVKVTYDNAPPELKTWFGHDGTRTFSVDRIVDFDKSKEKLELRLIAKNYNI
jgi:hypothetical protein